MLIHQVAIVLLFSELFTYNSFIRLPNLVLLVYLSYLYFQLFSHSDLYEDTEVNVLKSTNYKAGKRPFQVPHQLHRKHAEASSGHDLTPPAENLDPVDADISHIDPEVGSKTSVAEETPQMSIPMTISLLVAITVVR